MSWYTSTKILFGPTTRAFTPIHYGRERVSWAERCATFLNRGGCISNGMCLALRGQHVRSQKRPTGQKTPQFGRPPLQRVLQFLVYHSSSKQHDDVKATDHQAVRRCIDAKWCSAVRHRKNCSTFHECRVAFLDLLTPHDSDSRLPGITLHYRSEPPRSTSSQHYNSTLI